MAGRLQIDRLPGRRAALTAGKAVRRRIVQEWTGTPPHRWLLAQGHLRGFGIVPQDLRPANLSAGRQILAGAFALGGEVLAAGRHGDPWDRPSPSRRFAVALHRFGWMRDLLAAGPEGAGEGLRLTLAWARLFGGWNSFAWSGEVLERRVFNLACTSRNLAGRASDAEATKLGHDLLRQARALLQLDEGRAREAERACAAALAATALSGRAADQLLAQSLARLRRALPKAVAPDGGHVSRNPQQALELLFDLTTLDEALAQRGLASPEILLRAIDRLCGAVRFFTLGDGRLAAFQGGESLERTYVAAARAQDDYGDRPIPTVRNGYHRLEARSLQVMADAAPAASGPWSVAACAQPLAIEVLVGKRPLFVGGGWSPDAQAPQAMRLVDAASTASLGDTACGEPERGFVADVLGPRLNGGARKVEVRRHEAPGARWLELSHDGWVPRFGLIHERKLYIDADTDELRGEDAFEPAGSISGVNGRRFVPFTVRFHLHPDVRAQIASDRKSVLLRPEGDPLGWWLRNDAAEVSIEPSVYYQQGQPRRSEQIVLRGQARIGDGARVRWKLSPSGRVDVAAQEP